MNKETEVNYTHKVLEVKNLRKHFHIGSGAGKVTVPAVNNVSFDVYKREVFGLVGESGCGKTTTGRTLIKLYNPTDGYVKLNGIKISAGYEGHLREIKRIKKEMELAILEFDERKKKIFEINLDAQKRIDIKKLDIQNFKGELKEKIKEIKQPLETYNDQIYELKNAHKIDIESIKYEFDLYKNEVISHTKNESVVEYKNELAIAKLMYQRKAAGFNESAALSKEVVNEKIKELKEIYDSKVKELEMTYKGLIEESSKNLLDKNDAKDKIATAKENRDLLLTQRNEKYRDELEKLEKPDYTQIKEAVDKVKADYKVMIEAVQNEISSIRKDARETINLLDKHVDDKETHSAKQAKILEIKNAAQAKIDEEKSKISEAKSITKSKDSLVASRKMQMIFQDPISSLNPRMTVREIIGEGLTILGGYTKEEIAKKVDESLSLVGLLPEYATRYPHEFSGGQRQRIGIARALIMKPDFIIADEPISALDVSIRAQVINLLSQLKEELGLTILFIAHDLSVVRFFCDRIAVMYYGKIVELATSEEIFNRPMHAYTKSLLSAIPQPDPDYEKGRVRVNYNAKMHDYRVDKPSLKEVAPGHLVYCNESEFEEIKVKYADAVKNEGDAK